VADIVVALGRDLPLFYADHPRPANLHGLYSTVALLDLTPLRAASALTAELAVVVPVYNEEATIRQVLTEWEAVFQQLGVSHQFVLINDGSKDGTLEILRELEADDAQKLIILSKPNSGHGRSCRMGYDLSVCSSVQWVFQIDSDGQCDPAYFAEFWKARMDKDCVFGVRAGRDDGALRRLTSQICRLGSSILSGMDLRDPNVPYRLIRKEVLRSALVHIPTDFNIHNVALTYVLKKTPGLRWTYVPIHFRNRQGGNNSINVMRVVQSGIEMLLELGRLK